MLYFGLKKIVFILMSISDEEVVEEDNVIQPQTNNQFVEPGAPIDMEFVNNILIDNPNVEAEEQTHIQEHEVVDVRIRYIHQIIEYSLKYLPHVDTLL